MRLSLRGRRLVYGLAASLAFGAGVTAQHWNPVARQLDRCGVERFEDGSALVRCGSVRWAVHNDPVTDR